MLKKENKRIYQNSQIYFHACYLEKQENLLKVKIFGHLLQVIDGTAERSIVVEVESPSHSGPGCKNRPISCPSHQPTGSVALTQLLCVHVVVRRRK